MQAQRHKKVLFVSKQQQRYQWRAVINSMRRKAEANEATMSIELAL